MPDVLGQQCSVLPISVGDAVKELRRSLALTQERFAHELGMGIVTIQRWESGAFKPLPAALVKLYQRAMTSSRSDLAGIFLSGGSALPGFSQVRKQLEIDKMDTLRDYFGSIALSLNQAALDRSLSESKKIDLVTNALRLAIEGEELSRKFFEDSLTNAGESVQ